MNGQYKPCRKVLKCMLPLILDKTWSSEYWCTVIKEPKHKVKETITFTWKPPTQGSKIMTRSQQDFSTTTFTNLPQAKVKVDYK